MIRSRIVGTGRAVPERIVTNEELSQRLPTSDQWIRERTGIRERRLLGEGEVTSDLCARAGRAALEAAGLEASQLDLIIVATVTPDMMMPSCATITQHKLGARCPAFDLGAACAGFTYGLSVADGLVRSGQFGRVLLIGAEALSRFIDWDDRGTAILFGDGAGAVVLVGAEDPRAAVDPAARGILATYLAADGSQVGSLNILGGGTQHPPSAQSVADKRHVLRMDGRAVFGVAVRAMSDACERVLAAAAFPAESVDFVLPHQANLRIIDAIVRRLSLAPERVLVNLDRYGNTSSASIPIALDEAVRDGRIRTGSTILSCGMGAGLTWGAALIRW
jgi:3-oxoacyl-[acyl-carrier-protein] synthase III